MAIAPDNPQPTHPSVSDTRVSAPQSYFRWPRLAPHWLVCGMAFSLVFATTGATCARRETLQRNFRPPVIFEQTPTLAEVTQHLNRSLAIHRIESNSLTVSSPNIPVKLTGSLIWERTENFSLQAYPFTRAMMGNGLIAGSNPEMFWLQTQGDLFYARYDEFNRQSGPRKILPVSPLWLREAMGIVEMNPSYRHDAPLRRGDGKLQVVTYIPSQPFDPRFPQQNTEYKRVLILDGSFGTIEQTLLYNPAGKLVAQATQSEHDDLESSEIGWPLPHRIDVQLHPDEGESLAFTVEVGFYLLNDDASATASTFTLPDLTGLSTYDLVKMNASLQAVPPNPPVYTQAQPPPGQSSLVNYRTVR